jgi:hypothetical protein
MLSHLSRGKLLTKGNYERLVSHHNRELLEGTVGAVAKSAKEDGVEKGIRKERERILARIVDRVSDLRSCTKTDGCRELADSIESYIPEWIGEIK